MYFLAPSSGSIEQIVEPSVKNSVKKKIKHKNEKKNVSRWIKTTTKIKKSKTKALEDQPTIRAFHILSNLLYFQIFHWNIKFKSISWLVVNHSFCFTNSFSGDAFPYKRSTRDTDSKRIFTISPGNCNKKKSETVVETMFERFFQKL